MLFDELIDARNVDIDADADNRRILRVLRAKRFK
jgi:hypothetical protein